MSNIRKKSAIVLAVVVGVCVILTIIAKLGNNPVSNAINSVFSPVETVVAKVTSPVRNFFGYLGDIKNFREENEILKSEIETLKKESRNQEELKKENTRLKKLLQLTDELDNCVTVPAKVVGYEPGNWFYTLTINKGKNQDIKVSDVVITKSGVVGKVIEVGSNWSRISTILDPGNSVGIKLTRSGDVGIAEGDLELLKKKNLKLGYIFKETSVISGDLLETSGLGGIYPPGLSVGTIDEIELDNTGEIIKAVIKPSVNFDELYEVIVVTHWENMEYDKDRVLKEYNEEHKPVTEETENTEETIDDNQENNDRGAEEE